MNPTNSRLFSYEESMEWIHQNAFQLASNNCLILQKNQLIIEDPAQGMNFCLHLPPLLPEFTHTKELLAFCQKYPIYPPPYLILLIQAGKAALGHVEEGEILNHKVIHRYMIRGNGKAQYNHLKSKGKSKAGSRVRLGQSEDFCEEINQKLLEWEVDESIEYIFYSCSIPLWNMLFEAETLPPFDKKDERLRKIPKDIPVPSYETLTACNEFLLTSNLEWAEEEMNLEG